MHISMVIVVCHCDACPLLNITWTEIPPTNNLVGGG